LGNAHIVVVAKDKLKVDNDFGDVFTWGLDHSGRLGYITENLKNEDEEVDETSKLFNNIYFNIEHFIIKRIPHKLVFPNKEQISRVSCGVDFTACISSTGKLYTFGNNRWNNLGLSKKTIDDYLNTRGGEIGYGNKVIKEPQLVESLANMFIIQVF